jgi:hypothetical protein
MVIQCGRRITAEDTGCTEKENITQRHGVRRLDILNPTEHNVHKIVVPRALRDLCGSFLLISAASAPLREIPAVRITRLFSVLSVPSVAKKMLR